MRYLRRMPSVAVENYVKQIYLGQHEGGSPQGLVPMGRLAAAVGVTPGTATTMIKTLADAGLVAYEPRGGVRLTKKGEKLALHVLRRHRLVELFLVNVLGFDWSDVHTEAEELEHAVSDNLIERISAFLGHPLLDPHGDPIPTAEGTVDDARHARLAEGRPGKRYRVTRVLDQNPAFLKFIEEHGLKPASRVLIQSRDDAADAVAVLVKDQRVITLGMAAATKILVTPV